VLGATVGLLLAAIGCDSSQMIPTNPPDEETGKEIQSQLEARTTVIPPADPTVLAMVMTIPAAGEGSLSVSMLPVSHGSLDPSGLLGNTGEALDRCGTFVEVRDAQGAPRFLAEVQDPRYSRGEGLSLDPSERTRGRLSSVSSRAAGGALGIRIPFLPEGEVRVFTVVRRQPPAINAVQDTLFREAFPHTVPAEGLIYGVAP
jgi:hypothetical protein